VAYSKWLEMLYGKREEENAGSKGREKSQLPLERIILKFWDFTNALWNPGIVSRLT